MMEDLRATKEPYKHMNVIPVGAIGKDVLLYGPADAKFLNILREKLEVCAVCTLRRCRSSDQSSRHMTIQLTVDRLGAWSSFLW
jgi:hypothetical protein